MTKHYDESLFMATESGEFSVEVVPGHGGFRMGWNTAEIIVHDKADRDVVGASVKIEPWMPSMGHGVLAEPEVEEKGGGLYAVRNLMLSMIGDWELRIEVSKGDVRDTVVFKLPGIKDTGKHKMGGKPGRDLDISTERSSANGHFDVSYESVLKPLAINRIHNWVVTVKGKDGKPVDGAEVSVSGTMPEHGHGLPTSPEVTEYLGDGRYLIEGMKFSMPGWWVVKFEIQKKGIKDEVSFNLDLK